MKIAIIKYNAGNLFSVDCALKRLGVEPIITHDKEMLLSADKVIFPGVGEARTTMDYLKGCGLDQLIKDLKQPVLGICLGMQLLCRHSEEGDVDCLGIFNADVKNSSQPTRRTKCPTWDGTRFRISAVRCSKDLRRKNSSISSIVSMCRSTSLQRPLRNISRRSVRRCTRITSMPPSSIRKRVERWANVSCATS